MEYKKINKALVLKINATYDQKSISTLLEDLMIKPTINIISNLSVNKQKAYLDSLLNHGDILSLLVFNDEEIDFVCSDHEPSIIYEDDFILVVYKKANMLVHPDSKEKEGTLANDVAFYYACNGIMKSVRPIHRLDYETSGLVIFCKCSILQPLLDKMIATKQIKRYYLAVVDGYLKERAKIHIDAKIGRDRHNAKKYLVSESGKSASTYFTSIKANILGKYSLIKCELESGRTHQIRVHLLYLKHPIVSDPLYGERFEKMPRMALEAYMIKFKHPITNTEIVIEIPLDQDIKDAFMITSTNF